MERGQYHKIRADELGFPEGTGKRYSSQDLEDFYIRHRRRGRNPYGRHGKPPEKSPLLPIRRGDMVLEGIPISYEIEWMGKKSMDDDQMNELDEIIRISLRHLVPRIVEGFSTKDQSTE